MDFDIQPLYPTFVGDVASLLKLLLHHLVAGGELRGIYHWQGPDQLSELQIAKVWCEAVDGAGILWDTLGFGIWFSRFGGDGLMLDFTNLLRALSSTCQKTYCGWLQVMELDPAESSHDNMCLFIVVSLKHTRSFKVYQQ